MQTCCSMFNGGKLVKLPYNIRRHQDELYIKAPSVHAYKMGHYRQTALIQWLEANVGKSNDKLDFEYMHGDGWKMNGHIELYEDNGIKVSNWIEFIELSEELQIDFILRFS